jgi:hypothetical protein
MNEPNPVAGSAPAVDFVDAPDIRQFLAGLLLFNGVDIRSSGRSWPGLTASTSRPATS